MMKKTDRSMKLSLWIIAAAVLAVFLVSCRPVTKVGFIPVSGGKVVYPIAPSKSTEMNDQQAVNPAPPAAVATSPIVLYVSMDPEFGRYLVDVNGMALYAFTGDEPDFSNCGEACREIWPPLVTDKKASGDMDVHSDLIGSAMSADGLMIVTYNHMPLYYSARDWKPGLATGHGWDEAWYLVSPEGDMIGR